jgi:hypothetical protein
MELISPLLVRRERYRHTHLRPQRETQPATGIHQSKTVFEQLMFFYFLAHTVQGRSCGLRLPFQKKSPICLTTTYSTESDAWSGHTARANLQKDPRREAKLPKKAIGTKGTTARAGLRRGQKRVAARAMETARAMEVQPHHRLLSRHHGDDHNGNSYEI